MQRSDVLIEAEELLTKLDDPNLRIFDATIAFFRQEDDPTAQEQYQKEHLPNAGFFDHDNFSISDAKYMYTVLEPDDLARAIGEIGISAENEVVIYTMDMLASGTRAWWVLRYAGHQNVRVLNGGLNAWKAAGGETASGGHQYAPTTFEGILNPAMFVDKDEVQAALATDKTATVYTLAKETYGGKFITGTTCLPFTALAPDMQTLVADDEMAKLIADEAQSERVITYCGGGIAATVNAVAHLIAGNENVAVYDGSLSEWMGEGLPVSTEEA